MDSIAKQAEEIRSKEERDVRGAAKSVTIVTCVLVAIFFGGVRLVGWIFFNHELSRSDLYWGVGGMVILLVGMWLLFHWEEERRIQQQRIIRIELLLKQHVEKAEDRHADLLDAVRSISPGEAIESISPDREAYRATPLPLPK